jgi:hypothetical protein
VWIQKYHKKKLFGDLRRELVSQVVGQINDKTAIDIARLWMGRQRNFTGEHFWARGYNVSTVGLCGSG